MAARAVFKPLIVRSAIPKPSISSVLSITPSPLAVAVTKVTPGGTMILPAQTPKGVTVTIPVLPTTTFPSPLAVTVTKPTSYINGTYFASVMAESTLVGYWRLNEPSGTSAVDIKAANNGVYTSSPSLGNAGPLTLWADSEAVRFTGSSYVSIPDSNALDVGDVFTVECLFKRGTTGINGSLISKQTNAFDLGFQTDNKIWLGQPNVGYLYGTTSTVTDTDWHHVAVTKNGGTVHIYLDGADETLSGSNLTLSNNALPLLLGIDTGGVLHADDHYLAEVAIYNTALSGATVTNHYNNAVTDGLV